MNRSVTLQNLDEATGNWLFAEAQKRNVSVESLTLEIIHNFFVDKTGQQNLAKQNAEQQYAEAYAKYPVQPDEFYIEDSQLVWGDE